MLAVLFAPSFAAIEKVKVKINDLLHGMIMSGLFADPHFIVDS